MASLFSYPSINHSYAPFTGFGAKKQWGIPIGSTPGARLTVAANVPEIVATFVMTALLIAAPCHAFDAQVFTNHYEDPFHPLCKRHIQVSDNGRSFRYDGTAVGPKNDPVLRGCSDEEIAKYGLRLGSFEGQVVGNKISAGDGVHEGFWEPAGSVTGDNNIKYTNVDGIRWNDGNKWIVKKNEIHTVE